MINPKTIGQLTSQYEKYLDEVVDRLWVIVCTTQEFQQGKITNQYPQIDLDLCVLQLRKALEVVGYMCLLAHRPELGKLPKKLIKSYSPEDILKRLKSGNSQCFPVAVQSVDIEGGVDLQPVTEGAFGPALTEAEFLVAYGKFCGNRLHAKHNYERGTHHSLAKEMSAVRTLALGLMSLLGSHQICVKDKYLLLAHVNGPGGATSAAFFDRIGARHGAQPGKDARHRKR